MVDNHNLSLEKRAKPVCSADDASANKGIRTPADLFRLRVKNSDKHHFEGRLYPGSLTSPRRCPLSTRTSICTSSGWECLLGLEVTVAQRMHYYPANVTCGPKGPGSDGGMHAGLTDPSRGPVCMKLLHIWPICRDVAAVVSCQVALLHVLARMRRRSQPLTAALGAGGELPANHPLEDSELLSCSPRTSVQPRFRLHLHISISLHFSPEEEAYLFYCVLL